MKTLKILSFIALTGSGFAYADTSVTSFNAGVSSSVNPYTLVSGSSNVTSTDNSSASMSTSAAPAPVVSAPAAPAPVTSSVTSKTIASPTSTITYVQPANQVGQYAAATQPVQFTQTAKGSNAQAALQNATLGATNYGAAPDPTGITPVSSNYLQQIMVNTGQTQTSMQSMQNIDQQLDDYWMKTPTNDQLLNAVSGYGSVSTLQNMESSSKALLTDSTQGATQNNISTGYLNTLMSGASDDSQVDQWGPALKQALSNLTNSQNQMQALHEAVNAPFGGQSQWLSQIQTASTPQLLRVLVMEQALNNYMAYQSLQRQQDQELLAAAQLRMLVEINRQMHKNSNDQYQQLRRIGAAIEESIGAGK